MKRVLIGGFLSLNGMLGLIAIFIFTAMNLVSSWATPPGRFLTTVSWYGITPLFVLAWVMLVCGVVIMGIELFKRDCK